MCTIMTIDRQFFSKNYKTVLDQIESDATFNSDGFSLVMLGENKKDTLVLKSLSIENILNAIENFSWNRMFLHCRMSTSSKKSISQTHALQAFDGKNNWYIMHNGILKNTRRKTLDSLLITDLIKTIGIEKTIEFLLYNENYANCFFINAETGEYKITRSGTGTLYTDNQGNFSSHAIGAIDIKVQEYSEQTFDGQLVEDFEWDNEYDIEEWYRKSDRFKQWGIK